MKEIYAMQASLCSRKNQTLNVAEFKGVSHESEMDIKETSIKSLNPLVETQNVVEINKLNALMNNGLLFKKTKKNIYNSIFHNSMKQLSFLLKLFSFLVPLLSFGSYLFIDRNKRWHSHFKDRFLIGNKLGLAALVLLLCMSGFVHAAEVDLAIKQSVSNATPSTGGAVKYTVYLVNQGNSTATNVVIENKVPINGLGSVSVTQTSGSWSYNGTSGVGFWTVPSIAGGDSVRLEINGVASAPGVFFNIAQIQTSPDTDIDSVPGNTNLTEDDIATSCFSVPIEWYAGHEYTVEVPAPFSYGTGIVWFRNNQPIGPNTPEASVNANNSLTIRGTGSYTFTTSLTTCSATGCCPIILNQGPIFDLAFTKTSNVTSVIAGGQITYTLNVFNQGNVAATAIQLSDYIPAGLTLADPNWTQSGSIATLVNPIATLAAGASTTRTITFNVSSTATGLVSNSAEISSARGPLGQLLTDIDSTPDGIKTNDGVAQDDNISGNGKAGGDEDDADYSDITVTALASIGNFVWLDANQNGIQDAGENGISGVNVTLERPDGSVVATTTTGINGQYLFANLAQGSYVVAFGKPSGYTSSTPNTGADDATDSDADPISGKTGTYVLVAGEFKQTVDAGFYLPSCADIISISALDSDICSGDSTHLVATSSNGVSINWYLVPSGGTPLFTANSGQNSLVYPTTTTVYYAQLSTIAPSCPTDRTPVALVVNQRPLNPTCGKLIEVCSGETANLNSHIVNGTTTPGGVFEWHTGFLPTSPLVTNPLAVSVGNYYLFEKSAAGCYSNPTLVMVVTKSCAKIIDLSLLKTADRRTVNLNDNIVYTIQLSNAGPDEATNVKIEDKLPSGLQFVFSSTLTNTNGVLTATIPSLLSGQTLYFTYTARATGSGSIINVAEVVSADQRDSDSTPGNGAYMNEDDDDDEVINISVPNPIADLSLQKLVSNSSPALGDNIIYTIRVSNAGPNNATNVEVQDILPAGLTLVSVTGADINTSAGSTATATFSNILTGSSEEFYITARVIGSGSILNRAEVTKSDQLDPDSTPNNGGNEDDDDTNTITVLAPCNPTTPLISCANPYICLGESVSISAVGCNGTVVWSNGMTGSIITVSPSATISYNARCQVGTCLSPNSNNVQIIVNSIAPPLITASSNTVCAGGSVTLTATGCTGTVTWSNGVLGSSISVSPTASITAYTATCRVLTCISNVSNIQSITLTSTPIAPMLATTNANICSGQSTTLTATLCSGTVTWSTGQTGASITVSPLVTTSYTATCSVGSCVSVVSSPLVINVGTSQTPTILASKDNTCGGEPVILTVSNCSGGILWSNGATTLSIAVTPTATSTYSVTCGTGTCAATAQKIINVGGLGMTPTITASANDVCANTPITLTATNCIGTITWSLTSNPSVALGTGSTFNISPIMSVSYTATCATGTGCRGFATIAVNVTSNSIAPIVTCGAERICAGDSLVFTAHNCTGTVNWSNGSVGNVMTVRPTVNTTYSATCTINGCVSPASVPVLISVITQTPTITASSETVCAGGNVTLTASNCTGTLRWNTGATSVSINVSPTVQTTYSLTCTVEGCLGTASKVINIGTGQVPTLAASNNNICAGTSVVLTASNCASTITWNTGATGNSITVIPANTTTYSASCGNASCSGVASITVNVSNAQVPVITVSNAFICAGQSTTLTASGCSGGLTWSNGATTAAITVNPTVNTIYTASCGTGVCLRSVSQEINVVSQNTPTLVASNSSICAGQSVTITASNCASGLVWSTGATSSSITVMPTATTTYTANCGSGTCIGSSSVTINVSNAVAAPVVTASVSNLCQAGSVTLTATGCTGTVKWSNNQTGTTQTLTVNATQTFSATCTSGTCVSPASNSVTVNFGALSAPVITSTGTVVCNGSGVTLNATNCSGNILWSNGMTTSQISVSPVVNTTYTAICRSANQNCDSPSSNSIAVTVSPIPNAPVITCSADRICLGESLILKAIGCEGIVTWNYNNTTATGNTLTINPAVTTVYTTTCTIGNCVSPTSGAATITVGNPIAPIVTCNNTVICSGTSTTLEAEGCVGTVKWSNGMEGSVISVSPTTLTTYYAVCDAGICESAQSNAISVVVTSTGVAKPTVKDMVNVCPNTTVDLTAAVTSNVPVGGTYVYRLGSTPQSPVVSNPTSISTSGTYYVFASMGNGCFSEGSRINVGIVACGQPQDNCVTSPATASCGANETYCLTNDFITLNGSIGGAATSAKWTSNGTGTFENSITPVTKYFFSAQDITNGTVTLTLTTNDPDNAGPCQAATSSKVVTINGVSAVPTITTNKSPIICLGDSVLLTASVSGTNTYMWSNGATTRSILVKTPGSYRVQYVNAGGCRSINSAVTQVNLSSSITPPTVIAQAKNTCPASTVNLVSKVTSTPTTIGGVYEYHVNNNPTSPMLASTNAVGAGTYYVFEKTLTGCYSNSAAITVAIDNCNIVQADADIQVDITGNKTSVVIGDEVIYTIQVKNNGPAAATNVVVLNELPEGLIVQGGTPGLLAEGTNLKIVIPTLAVGATRTYTYTAKLTKAGKVNNVVKKISANQNDPINSNNTDNFAIECNTCEETCIATAFKADTIRQSNGSFNIKFTTLLKNCGNVALSGVELDQSLSSMFPSPTTFTIIQKPTPSATSTVVGNDSFNGTSNIAVLNKLSSTLPVGKTDTVVFVINLLPMGTEGPYSTNAIAKGVGMTTFGIAQDVSDVSNDGTVVVKELADPTVVKLFKSPSIAIVLAVKDTVMQTNGSYNVTFQAIVKNNGSLDLSNVIVTDTLSKYFGAPASFTMVGTPGLNQNSSLTTNNAFNGASDSRLTLPTSKLAVGKQDTIVFTINLVTSGNKEFQNKAIANGTGTLANATTSTVTDVSNSGVNPNIPGSSPTMLVFGSQNQGSEINTCVGLAIATINKTKQEDGTYNITYQAIVKNCGNLTLTNVAICDTLSNTFSSPAVAKVVVKPFTNSGSTLAADTTFNGITNTCLLNAATSSLVADKTDTLRWTINVKLNGNNGPFRNNITVNSTSPSGQVVSDVSNDGINPAPAGSNPTVLNFNDNIRDEVIGLAKNLVGITKVPNKSKVFDVEFTFVLKNYGNVPFTKVQLQDNLAYTFGDKVIIDSVYIKNPEAGLVANSNYTGKGELINLLADSLSTLPLNSSKTVGLVVRVDMSMADTLKYENIALARGHYNGGSVTDASVTGLNPDGDLSGDPTDDSDPTLIDFTDLLDLSPITPLGIAKSVDTLGSADGSYLLTYKVIVKNFGSTKLDSVQLTDDLAGVFSSRTQFVLMGVPTLNDSSKLKINAKYDGDSVKTMLIANQSSLAAGKSDTLTFKVKVINNDLEAQTYLNTIVGTALSDTTLVSDKSNSGALADEDNDGNPGNDNEPTGITLEPASQDTSAVNVIVYDGLTPNGDGKNDVLVIKDKENRVILTADDNISINIYNRWGHLVFESANYFKDYPQGTDTNSPNGWDGTSKTGVRVEKDKYVPDGTYYYVVSSTNAKLFGGKPYVNFITVKR